MKILLSNVEISYVFNYYVKFLNFSLSASLSYLILMVGICDVLGLFSFLIWLWLLLLSGDWCFALDFKRLFYVGIYVVSYFIVSMMFCFWPVTSVSEVTLSFLFNLRSIVALSAKMLRICVTSVTQRKHSRSIFQFSSTSSDFLMELSLVFTANLFNRSLWLFYSFRAT